MPIVSISSSINAFQGYILQMQSFVGVCRHSFAARSAERQSQQVLKEQCARHAFAIGGGWTTETCGQLPRQDEAIVQSFTEDAVGLGWNLNSWNATRKFLVQAPQSMAG